MKVQQVATMRGLNPWCVLILTGNPLKELCTSKRGSRSSGFFGNLFGGAKE